jgi:hypothetical protein
VIGLLPSAESVAPPGGRVRPPSWEDLVGHPGYHPQGDRRAAYETHGTSLVRYVARRTAKTRLLLPLKDLLAPGDSPSGGLAPGRSADALALFGLYCAAAAVSFGRGYRQPTFDPTGTEITELDRETGAAIVSRLEGRGPGSRLRLAVRAELEGVGTLVGREEIVGTTVGLHRLGMPAPSVFEFAADPTLGGWSARATGTITTELAIGLGTRVRGHGSLDLVDSVGCRGTVRLRRDASVEVLVFDTDGTRVRARRSIVEAD